MSTIVMPEVMAGMKEAVIQRWLVREGDVVSAGQPLADVETEKAVVEYHSEVSGTVSRLLVGDGEPVAVGAPIAELDRGDAAGSATAPVSEAAAVVTAAPAPADAATPGFASAPRVDIPAGPSKARVFVSPLVRRLAREQGIDLGSVSGSGPGGRIVRRDLEVIAPSADPVTVAAASAREAAVPMARVAPAEVPHTPMRRAIARRLTESTTQVPSFTLRATCRADALIELRRSINDRSSRRVSLNDLVMKALAKALIGVPEANAIWTPDAMRRFNSADIGLAVSVPGGLMTPVVTGVDSMSVLDLADRTRDLAGRAREGRLRQVELDGGTIAVSNLGMFGTEEFSAIINPPHSAILAVGAAVRRPWLVGDELTTATVITFTLTADHRVMDGALAAQLLAAFAEEIEAPIGLLL